MTARQESMPCLNGARAQWDAEKGLVRYYANFDGADEWIEVPGEDFSRLVQLSQQEALDVLCETITSTLDNVKATLAEFTAFRQEMEKLSRMTQPSAPEGAEN